MENFHKTPDSSKQAQIQIHHIRSHEGQSTPEQIGNDKADKVAKIYMSEGEDHEDDLIEGDIRLWLKEKEKEQMLDKWRSLKVQGRLVRRFPKQVIDLGKLAWKWAIERVDGRAWVYFIFLVYDWLPTNFLLLQHIGKGYKWFFSYLCGCFF